VTAGTLSGNTILVCGASKGIGKAACETVLGLGANIIQVGRDGLGLEEHANSWRHRYPNQTVVSIALDLTLDSSAARLAQLLPEESSIDGLVVTIGSGAPLSGDFISDLRMSLDVNLFSAANAVIGTLDGLQRSSMPSVVLLSSIAGHELIACPPEYAASKAALEVLSKHWSQKYAPIRFNIVAPGNIQTEQSVWARRMRENPKALERDLAKSVPLSRLGKPQEIAQVIAFLLSKESSFISGSVITADGGQQRSIR